MWKNILLSSLLGLATAPNPTWALEDGTVHRQLVGGNRVCGSQRRTRKHWIAKSKLEQDLYLEALDLAIQTNKFQHFAKVHTEQQSEHEAHDTCAFLLWHKKYLLAFENMLRTMGDGEKFKCVTIPYWNTMDEFKDQFDGKCKNIGECSPIVHDIGGKPASTKIETRKFAGSARSGICYTGNPFKNYCDDNDQCGCLVRGDVSKVQISSGQSYVSIFNLISENKNYEAFSNKLQSGLHNKIHSDMGGFMASMQSPVDPLFFSWHAAIDMLHYVWHLCHSPQAISGEGRKVSDYALNTCTSIGPDSSITMKIKVNGTTVNVEEHPVIGEYFQGVADAYYELADSRSMGDYTYDIDIPLDFHRHMLSNNDYCPNAVAAGSNNWVDPEASVGSGSGQDDDGYFAWYAATKADLEKKFPNDPEQVELQLEYLDCIGFDNKFGVTEWSEEFVNQFLMGKDEAKTRCEEILVKIENKEIVVEDKDKVDDWAPKAKEDKDAEAKRKQRVAHEKDLKESQHKTAQQNSASTSQYVSAITCFTTFFAMYFASFEN